MNKEYEEGRKKLEELIVWNKKFVNIDRNEDTTRLHLIDSLLFDCLNWKKEDVITEESFDAEFTDYTLRLPRPSIIVEAKREGNYFELPSGKNRTEYNLSNLCRDNPDLKKAVEQVSAYCQKRGTEIAIISNGWQLVSFVAVRLDGIPPIEGKALVYDSLENMLSRFTEFWNHLSYDGISKKILKTRLCGTIIPELPTKLSSIISNYPGIKNRNSNQADLQVLSEIVFEDVIKTGELETIFLEECYCNAGALSNYSSLSKDILKLRYENFFDTDSESLALSPASGKKGINEELVNVTAQSLSRRPILLIGDVGVGKSTFINYLIKVEAKEIFENCITFKIDLGSQAILASNLNEAIVEEIIKQLLDNYDIDIFENHFVRGIYHGDFERFKRGVYKPYFENNHEKSIEISIEFFIEKQRNKVEHLKNALFHLAKGRKKQIVIFIDNCDQREYDIQQKAFLISNEIAEHWQPVTIFLALRPESFHNSLKKGSLTGYHPKAFTIAPPRIDLVIEKRLDFARKIAEGEIPLSQFNKSENKVGIQLSNLSTLIHVLIFSLEKNKELHKFIEDISCGNVRKAVGMITNFLGSGHVDTKKIIQIQGNGDNYIIPLHEFFNAVIYGDNIHFDPNSSQVSNIFDIKFDDPKEHFLTPIVLSILESQLQAVNNNGFFETSILSNHLQSLGFTIDQIDIVLSDLIEKNLIETSARGRAFTKINLPPMLRLTSTGSYHINNLCSYFPYIDAIIVDTPIFKEAKNEIKDIHGIINRLERVIVFKNYLDEIWKKFDSQKTFFNWSSKSIELQADINKIKAKQS